MGAGGDEQRVEERIASVERPVARLEAEGYRRTPLGQRGGRDDDVVVHRRVVDGTAFHANAVDP